MEHDITHFDFTVLGLVCGCVA